MTSGRHFCFTWSVAFRTVADSNSPICYAVLFQYFIEISNALSCPIHARMRKLNDVLPVVERSVVFAWLGVFFPHSWRDCWDEVGKVLPPPERHEQERRRQLQVSTAVYWYDPV